ncbi:lipopolysaccharide/colanic/teichoic acid biosynthesis glycosyltransferase [Neobacillus niacini]|uniref:DNA-directed RNA polymerase subunit beta n=1 Tax=Neobacillus driksii TaxID=3035913 RepID=UPI002780E0F2|nr:DNA-directed RNA polymerase subunit beta [Neobacillus niacini]MDQ0974531.1 lipopolysaccharide/colanic/teichoic acid biosynthesis glycosyltransferase [Neobacillus niacini]
MSVNHLNQVKTREEYKKAKGEDQQDTTTQKTSKVAQKAQKAEVANKRIRIRLIPIWLRILLLVIFTGVFMVAGAAIGYGVLGNGDAGDVLRGSTWTHIIDLVEKK